MLLKSDGNALGNIPHFSNQNLHATRSERGGLAEWSNAPVLKTDVRESVPRVRIPEPPPLFPNKLLFLNVYLGILIAAPPR